MDRPGGLRSAGFQHAKKASQSLGPQAQTILGIIFPGDMCVGENPSRLANVHFVRFLRTKCALQRAAAFSSAKSLTLSTT